MSENTIETTRAEPAAPVTPHRYWSARRITVVAVAVLGGLAIRAAFFQYQSGDYRAYFAQWYQFIGQHGGFPALKYNFANYNVPYLYLMALLSYTPIPALYAVKLISVLFDLLLAFFTCRIVALRHPGTWWPVLAGAVVLYLPTVVLNSSAWAQTDSIYSAFALGGLYFVLRRRPWLACVFFGLAFAVKLQAIFLFPVLLLLVLRRRVPWRALLLIPAVYLLLDLPALAVGANFRTLLSVYLTETNTYNQLTLNASNVYQYLGNANPVLFRALGIAVTGLLILALIVPVVLRRLELTDSRIVLASTVSVVLVPYFLPAMHERYFYLADGLTVIAACYLPRRLWALPVLEQFASAFSYAPFLLMGGGRRGGLGSPAGGGFRGRPPGGPNNTDPARLVPRPGGGFRAAPGGFGQGGGPVAGGLIDFRILATAMLAALVLVLWSAIRDFRSSG